MVDYAAMGSRIKMKRRSKKLSQKDMAQAIQISTSYYGNIERGRRIPSIDTLVAIANALEVGMDFLLADSLKSAQIPHSPEELRVLTRYLRDRVAELDYGGIQPEEVNPFLSNQQEQTSHEQ